MTPKQTFMWFCVILIMVGVLWGIVAFLMDNADHTFYGGGIAVVGIVLAFISKKIRWK